MKKVILILITALLVVTTAVGQTKSKKYPQIALSGKNINKLFPETWLVERQKGDLNKDGIPDLAFILHPEDAAGMEVVKDSPTPINHNPYILVIYFGNSSGEYQCFRYWSNDAFDTSGTDDVGGIKLTSNGCLDITMTYEETTGASSGYTKYRIRYQSGDFYLIGKERFEALRTTGEYAEESYDLLNGRKYTKKGNISMDSNVKETTHRDKIPKKPLQRVGTFIFHS